MRGLSSRMANLQLLYIQESKLLRNCCGIDELYALEIVSLAECGKLNKLPCLKKLEKLWILNIYGCASLSALPGLSNLVALEELYDEECVKLATLSILVNLIKLQILGLNDSHVQGIPGLDGDLYLHDSAETYSSPAFLLDAHNLPLSTHSRQSRACCKSTFLRHHNKKVRALSIEGKY